VARVVSGSADAYPATVFEQVHPMMGDIVRKHALAALGPVSGLLVWDLYAGIGETTRALLDLGARVESVEIDGRAVNLAGPTEAPGVRRHTGAAEVVAARLPAPDLVITNPPRTGMDEGVIFALRQAGPGRLVYISCDPATLARDVGRLLAPGAGRPLRLASVEAFDLFPQTSHVESVALLEAA
jgi:23S rRNA (uracil1939-C5)-methyltransferase